MWFLMDIFLQQFKASRGSKRHEMMFLRQGGGVEMQLSAHVYT